MVGVGGEKGGHVAREESWLGWAGRDRRMPVGRREQISSGGQTVAPTLELSYVHARVRNFSLLVTACKMVFVPPPTNLQRRRCCR